MITIIILVINKNWETMCNLRIIKELCSEKKISIVELSKRIGITATGLHRIINTNSTKVETLSKIARELNVPITTFFENEKSLQEIEVSDILTSDEIIYVCNQFDTFSQKLRAYKDYYLWKVISLAEQNHYVKHPFYRPGHNEEVLSVVYMSNIRIIQKEMKNIPFSKWSNGWCIEKINVNSALNEAFYFTMFEKNIMNLTDYLKDNILVATRTKEFELIEYWSMWKQLDDKYKQHR